MHLNITYNPAQQPHTLSSFTSQRSNQSLPKSVPVLPENKKLKISPPFSKNLNTNAQTGDTNEKQDDLNLNIETGLNLRIKRMKKASLQHCISVMRAERLKLSLFASNEICDGRTVNAPKSRTTLILGRWWQA